MTIALVPFNELDPAVVAQNQATATQLVQDDNPQLYLQLGVLADILLLYHAILEAQQQQNVAAYEAARSLAALAADPNADAGLVDDVLSNYLLTRVPGSAAAGSVTIVVSGNTTITIAQGAVFSANGATYTTAQVFTAKNDPAQITSAGDRLMTKTADGNYAFVVDVTAAADGPAGNVAKGILIVPTVLPPGYVTSFATADFTPGLDPETNAALIARLQEGLTPKTLGGPTTMAAAIHAQPTFAAVPALSVIGMGDPEMMRDKHTIFPVALGGRVDWYVRTQTPLLRLGLTKTATLIEKLPNLTGVWQLALSRDDAPGYYDVESVLPAGATATGSFAIQHDARTLDVSGPGFIPDIDPASAEWAYTRYQAGVVQFIDSGTDTTNLSVGAQADYAVTVRCLPLIGDIQDWAAAETTRARAYDLLVKAPVPCFVSVSFTITKPAHTADPDTAAIAAAICAVVNETGFTGKLAASQIYGAIGPFLALGQTAGRLDMLGRIRRPDGSMLYVRDDQTILVPNDPASLVTAKTVQFFMEPGSVGVSIAVG